MKQFSYLPDLLPDESLMGYAPRLRFTLPFPTTNNFRIACGLTCWGEYQPVKPVSGFEMLLSNLIYEHFGLSEQPYWSHGSGSYYRAFLTESMVKRVNGLFGSKNYHPNSFLSPDTVKMNKSWCWCPLCVQQDYHEYGVSYWHQSHQIPSTFVCKKHGCLLISECMQCQHSVKFLKLDSMPPQNGKCPSCSVTVLYPGGMVSRGTQDWLQRMSWELLSVNNSLDLSNVFTKCIEEPESKLDLDSMFTKRSSSQIYHQTSLKDKVYVHLRYSIHQTNQSQLSWPNPLIWMSSIQSVGGDAVFETILKELKDVPLSYRPVA
jgi:hypothetical protein